MRSNSNAKPTSSPSTPQNAPQRTHGPIFPLPPRTAPRTSHVKVQSVSNWKRNQSKTLPCPRVRELYEKDTPIARVCRSAALHEGSPVATTRAAVNGTKAIAAHIARKPTAMLSMRCMLEGEEYAILYERATKKRRSVPHARNKTGERAVCAACRRRNWGANCRE